MQKMKNSGYDVKFRLEVLKSSINGFEKIVEDSKNGIKPIYRSKTWKESNNWNAKKKSKKENWWKGKSQVENKSVIFVPSTPRGELAKMFREVEKQQRIENKNSMNFQIIEQTGPQVYKKQEMNFFFLTEIAKFFAKLRTFYINLIFYPSYPRVSPLDFLNLNYLFFKLVKF